MTHYPNIERCITISSDHIIDSVYQDMVTTGQSIEPARGRRNGKTTAAVELLIKQAVTKAGTTVLYWTERGRIAQFAFIDALRLIEHCPEGKGHQQGRLGPNEFWITFANDSSIYFGDDSSATSRDYTFAVKDEWKASREHQIDRAIKLLIDFGVPEDQLDELVVMAKLAQE